MDDLLQQIGSRILSRRKQLRMTQEELAEKAGITPQTVSSAELGKKALRPENIIRICSALDISTDYLLLGKINDGDHSVLLSKVADLPPVQYRHLEDIINSFILALDEREAQSGNKSSLCFLTAPKCRHGICNQRHCRLIHFILQLLSVPFLFRFHSFLFRHMIFLYTRSKTTLFRRPCPPQYLRNDFF